MNFKRKHIIITVYIIVFLGTIAFLLFNKFGILKLIVLKNEIKSLELQIDQADLEIKKLDSEIDSLKSVDYKIEQVARQKHHMLREKEIAVKFIEE